MIDAGDKALSGNGSVSVNCVKNRLPPGRVCFVTTLQANAGNGYPSIWSDTQFVNTRRQP